MNKKPAWAGILLIVILLLTGCGARTTSGEDIDSIPQKLMVLNAVYEPLGVQPNSAYGQDGKVYLQVYKSGKPWEALSEDEKKKLENAIYDSLKYTFPLEIESFVLPDQADITGKITAVDKDADRVLIVNDKDKGSAVWVKLPANVLGGLKIGYQVNAWSNGIIAESYPRQTTGIQVQVVNYDAGIADIKGTITAVHFDDADATNSYVEIDGQKYQLQPYTLYSINDTSAKLQDIQTEVKAEVWLAGYQVAEEQIIAQLRITSEP